MTDERTDLPQESGSQQSASPPAAEPPNVVTSVTDMFGETKTSAARWLKAARSGPLRVLSGDEVVALAKRIAGDPKQMERLLGLLRQLSPTLATDGASAALIEIAECVLKQRAPELFSQASQSHVEVVLEGIARLRRELRTGRERHLWIEAILRTTLLNKMVDPMELPRLTRVAFGASPKVLKPSTKKRKSAAASGIVLDEEVVFLLSCLSKPPVLAGSLAISSIYQRRMSGLEDSLARFEAQIAERQREYERLEGALAAKTDLARERDAEIAKLREDVRQLQASWDNQRTRALHQIETLRGRIQGLLKGDLALWLETARDAATASPPRMAVVIERLERALERAAKEAEWLVSSDST